MRRQYVMTGIGVIVGYILGAFLVGAIASNASAQTIIVGELIAGTIGAVILGAAGWYGAQSTPADKPRKKR